MKILIGADPEVFAKVGGDYVSAHNMVPGTKEQPHPVKDGAVQVDGMALEFNINPAGDEDEFVHNINSVMEQLRAMVPEVELAADAVADFPREYIDAQPEEARELGCDPDYNAWKRGRENPVPDVDTPFRTGAGHIHIGLWDEAPDNHEEIAIELVRNLDYFLGIPSLLFDAEDRRRDLYGKAGAFRLKPYGVEYRVLSNKWLSSEALTRWAYSNTIAAVKNMSADEPVHEWAQPACDVIDNCQRVAARDIIDRFNIPMPEGFKDVG